MLDIQVKVEGNKVVIDGLNSFAGEIPKAGDRGLIRAAKGIDREAFAFLSGPGSKKATKKGAYAGGWPVPVRTGHLRRELDWLKPGESKSGEVGIFTAGEHEAVIYDAAEYAYPIFRGTGSSAKYGERDALKAGLEFFNQGNKIKAIIEEEVQADINKLGGQV